MTDLMKRYEAETGKVMSHLMEIFANAEKHSKEELINVMVELYMYTIHLEAQLTWRPASEKPKEGEIVFGMISTGWVVAQYINGELCVDDGFTFGDRIGDVIEWLPIPPSY